MRTYVTSSLAMAALLVTACTPPAPEAEEAPPVDLVAEQLAATGVVDQFMQMWVEEDMDLQSRIFAHDRDMVSFGTDAAEIWVGYDALRQSLETQFASYESTQVSVRDQVVKVGASGDVAWFSELADVQVTAGGESVSVDGMRFTGVLEKRNGAWVIVSIHGSVPVAGQVMEY